MHGARIVSVADALREPRLYSLLKYFRDSIRIMRTSGVVEGGWKLNEGTVPDPSYLTFINENWCIPCILDDDVVKHVPLKAFLSPTLLSANAGVFPDTIRHLIESSLTILDNGFYKADYANHMRCASPGSSKTVEEQEGVLSFKLANGQKVRMWMPALV